MGREVILPAALQALAQLDEAYTLLLGKFAFRVSFGECLFGFLVPRRQLPLFAGPLFLEGVARRLDLLA